jgi:hypothetical protein
MQVKLASARRRLMTSRATEDRSGLQGARSGLVV